MPIIVTRNGVTYMTMPYDKQIYYELWLNEIFATRIATKITLR